jgi:hypothetical protein
MPSPFPGIDPYIESSGMWGDFHTTLLVALRAKLNALMPRRYRAKVDVFVFIQVPSERPRVRRRLEPDTFVVKRHRRNGGLSAVGTMVAPSTITLPAVRKKKKAVLVVDRQMNRVVTAIEILSPSNKEAGDDRTAYLNKRGEYFGGGVSLVELDLLRGGSRLPLGSSPPEKEYYAMVCRAWEFPRADLWTFSIRDAIPDIPIPLAEGVPDTRLPLRECVERAHAEGCYDTEFEYGQPLTPALNKADSAWLRQLVGSRK